MLRSIGGYRARRDNACMASAPLPDPLFPALRLLVFRLFVRAKLKRVRPKGKHFSLDPRRRRRELGPVLTLYDPAEL